MSSRAGPATEAAPMVARVGPTELPLSDDSRSPRERADAARNRRRILEAARALLAQQGLDRLGMDDLARAACVGTGTLYRRFGDRAGLALALLDESERAFQETLLRGEPPLGPGAPPRERLHAFGRAYLELVEQNLELLDAALPQRPLAGGPFDFYLTHLRILLGQAGFTGDADYAVTSLMALLHPGLHRHLRQGRGWDLPRLADGFAALVDAWLAG